MPNNAKNIPSYAKNIPNMTGNSQGISRD